VRTLSQNLNDYTKQIVYLINDYEKCVQSQEQCWYNYTQCVDLVLISDSTISVMDSVINKQNVLIANLYATNEQLNDKVKRRNRWLVFSGVAVILSLLF
jgi:hypothetical protein